MTVSFAGLVNIVHIVNEMFFNYRCLCEKGNFLSYTAKSLSLKKIEYIKLIIVCRNTLLFPRCSLINSVLI